MTKDDIKVKVTKLSMRVQSKKDYSLQYNWYTNVENKIYVF